MYNVLHMFKVQKYLVIISIPKIVKTYPQLDIISIILSASLMNLNLKLHFINLSNTL